MPAETETVDVATRGTILVLDDEPIIRRVVERALQRQGYRVLGASGPTDALELLRNTPDVALLLADLSLAGGLSGASVAADAQALVPDLKVLYITGHSRQKVAEKVGEAHPAVLQKPFTPATLRAAVAEALGR